MRTTSVASATGLRKNYKDCSIPSEGSKIRELYDLLMANKGVLVRISSDLRGGGHGNIYCLMDFYGLDIRHVSKGMWMLVGEWFGKVYVDYFTEKVNGN